MMKRLVLILAIGIIGAFCMVGRSEATLIGIELALPDILSDSVGTYSYDASTDLLTFSATPVTITFDGSTLRPITGTTSYLARFYVDSSGNFSGGWAGGNDLEIYGDIDKDGDGSVDYTGLLVAGEITAFGWFDVPPTKYTLFDYAFDFKSGALSGYYAEYDNKGGDIVTSETSTFTADWTIDHSGDKTKHDTAPVPEPTSVILLGMGLLGIAGKVARKKFMA